MMSKLANSSATAGARGSPGAVPPLTGASHAPLASHMAAQAAMSSKQIVEAAAAAGPTAVVSAMWDHASRAGVQWRGCNALKDMAYNGGACPPWWPYVPQSCLWLCGCVAVWLWSVVSCVIMPWLVQNLHEWRSASLVASRLCCRQ